MRFVPLLFLLIASCCAQLRGASFLHSLSEPEISSVRQALEAMKKDPRGPYLRIRWYCKDGSVHPPAGTPCRQRGGGVQHAERNAAAKRLAELQFDVGVILQALTYEAFLDASADHNLPKQLVLQDYLSQVDDGWIYRRARYYRGARQIEDEEKQGQIFLERMFSDPEWLGRRFLLAVRLTAVTPHQTGAPQAAIRIRNLAAEIADLEPGFQPLRVKIHSYPSPEDAKTVAAFRAARSSAELNSKLSELSTLLADYYNARRIADRLENFQRRLPLLAERIGQVRQLLESNDRRAALSALARLAGDLRRQVSAGSRGADNLLRMDLLTLLHDRSLVLAAELASQSDPRPRAERIEALFDLFELAFAGGWLSERELNALKQEIAELSASSTPSALRYKRSLSYLSRSLDWGRAAARGAFGPQFDRYLLVEPKTSGFMDTLVRGSILLPLSAELGRLNRDADAHLGQSHFLVVDNVSQGVRGLNPGVAKATMEIVDQHRPGWLPDPDTIYVIPDTAADLKPMAGILTLDAGNLLSHAQLLARNLGIPNAAVSPSLLPQLRRCNGKTVLFAVSPLGLVLLKEESRLSSEEMQLFEEKEALKAEKITLETSRLRLDRVDPIPLFELRASDSGVWVGPKAANLGQLHLQFPGRVAPGAALPFGMFKRHIERPYRSDRSLREEIRTAYRRAAEMEREGRGEDEINEFMFPRLARFRRAITEMEWVPESRQAVVRAIRQIFSAEGVSEGIFVRSDTNAEDLPQFTGAGLNLTVPNQRSVPETLDAIKRVWASPFTERAYLWRRRLIMNQEDIYASVLLLQSVHSEKSGVLITSGLELGDPESLTVVTAEGVGGVVEGDSAETIVVSRGGEVKLLSQAKAPYRRVLAEKGGVTTAPSTKTDTLLTRDNISELRKTVDRWKAKIPRSEAGTIWDIEFGFVGSKLWLFQIRPFVGPHSQDLASKLSALDADAIRRGNRPISMREGI